jgi:NADH-quinone oxidoreductase subunit A
VFEGEECAHARREAVVMLEYLPVLLFVAVGLGFGAVTIAASSLIVPRRVAPEKMRAYECGVDPVGDARGRFSVKFYMVAVLFILFDIEAVFLYPWAVSFRGLGLYGLIEMVLFILILLAGYLYLLKKRALEWE